jgi:hypothetical protein
MPMRAQVANYRYADVKLRDGGEAVDPRDNLMTPARRAGLDALEREFSEFLKARPLTAGA